MKVGDPGAIKKNSKIWAGGNIGEVNFVFWNYCTRQMLLSIFLSKCPNV